MALLLCVFRIFLEHFSDLICSEYVITLIPHSPQHGGISGLLILSQSAAPAVRP